MAGHSTTGATGPAQQQPGPAAPTGGCRVFISYRREDSPDATYRLADSLRERFGADRVFIDIDTIDPGVDFVTAVEQAIARSDAVLVVIGPHWLRGRRHGLLQRDDEADYVHLELDAALRRGLPIVPVLVNGAVMPLARDLPPRLRELSRHNAHELQARSWPYDISRLADALERHRAAGPREGGSYESGPEDDTRGRRPRIAAIAIGAGVAVAAAVVGAVVLSSGGGVDDRTALQRAAAGWLNASGNEGCRYHTPRYIRESWGSRSQCEAKLNDPGGVKALSQAVRISGSNATDVVRTSDGQWTLFFQKIDGRWLINGKISADGTAIDSTVDRFLAGTGPARCELLAPSLINSRYGGTAGCYQRLSKAKATPATAQGLIFVNGTTATNTVATVAGPRRYALAKQNGKWLITGWERTGNTP